MQSVGTWQVIESGEVDGAIYRNMIRLFMIIYLLCIEYIVYNIPFTSYTLVRLRTN